MTRLLPLIACAAACAFPARPANPSRWARHPIARDEGYRGAALAGRRLYAWTGAELSVHELPSGAPRKVAAGTFGEGGCAASGGVVAQDGSRLVFFGAGRPETMDDGVELHDCLEAVLFGRKGVLAIHRYAQVRFYERRRGRWSYTEIYSIYTPSQQAGLGMADVDGDGRPDILCGNYWIRCPGRFELPWHVFAINTWFENPLSAMVRLAWTGNGVAAAEGHAAPGRLAWFERPADPRQLWTAHELSGGLVRPHALAAADFDGDGLTDLFAGENNGSASRWLLWWNAGGGRYRQGEIGTGTAAFAAWASDLDRDGRADLVLAGPQQILWLENRRD